MATSVSWSTAHRGWSPANDTFYIRSNNSWVHPTIFVRHNGNWEYMGQADKENLIFVRKNSLWKTLMVDSIGLRVCVTGGSDYTYMTIPSSLLGMSVDHVVVVQNILWQSHYGSTAQATHAIRKNGSVVRSVTSGNLSYDCTNSSSGDGVTSSGSTTQFSLVPGDTLESFVDLGSSSSSDTAGTTVVATLTWYFS